jgi:outer membrane protein TolC
MRHWFLALMLLPAFSCLAQTAPLTLAEVLSYADAAHPDRAIAESELAASLADRDSAASRQDFTLYLEGSLRTGQQPGGNWEPDNIGRIVARKPLADFGRTRQSVAAADAEIAARSAQLIDVVAARRIELMARYFDVLLADLQYAADNEFTAAAYVAWDNARDRFAQGQLSQPELIELEARYQDARERRNASLQRLRSTRQKLANAMNRPDFLPNELAEPKLRANDRAVAEYESLLPQVLERNPRMRTLDAQIAASEARIAAVRSERNPSLDAEIFGAGYSRESTTRDQLGAGLVFNVPLYQGARVDARLARERAVRERLVAQREKLRLELAETLLDTLNEIEWLRQSARPAADKQIEYRDWALERSRAEYELEIKTNLGTSMAETQAAKVRRQRVEYRLALALARLDALLGEMPTVNDEQGKK